MSETNRRAAEVIVANFCGRWGDTEYLIAAIDAAIARAVEARDAIYERDVRILTGEHKAELVLAVEGERERCAVEADDHCRYITRQCSPKHEEPCVACRIAAALRAPGEKA